MAYFTNLTLVVDPNVERPYRRLGQPCPGC
jgi:hypothetical protein